MNNIDELETLAKAAGGDAWTPTYATRTDLASVWLPDGDSVCRCHGNIGHWPEPIDADDVAEYIAAANPAAILELVAEVRALRADARNPGVRIERYSIPESGAEIIRTEQRTGPAKWKVFKDGYCLSKSGDWEYEPMPSSRTDDFIGRCRFDSAQEAIDAARGAK